MPDAPRPLPPKKEVALALLEGPSLFVHLDPRKVGVQVPKWFVGQPQLVLQVGLNMAIPIPDLKVDDDGVSCTLSFSRTPFWCRLPWSAIYALVGEDGRGMVWPQDVPPEVATQMQKQQATPAKSGGAKKGKAKLNAVEASDGDGAKPEQTAATRPSKRTRDESKSDSKESKRGADGSPKVQRAPMQVVSPAETAKGAEVGAAPTGPRAAPEPGHDGAAGGRKPRAPSGPSHDGAASGQNVGASGPEPAEPSPSDRPGSAGKKPKRELPPYLRVIK